jgi:hypothetical protein
MDTIKDRQRLETMHESGQAPWRRLTPYVVNGSPLPADVLAEPLGS